jgi:hypothetical protein
MKIKNSYIQSIAYLSIIILLIFTGCEDDEPEIPSVPCMEIPASTITVNTPLVFRVCSKADVFTVWPGDEGQKYENYGIDKGIQLTADSLIYTYTEPGDYQITVVAINQLKGEYAFAINTYNISVSESLAAFKSIMYDKVFPPVNATLEGDTFRMTLPFTTDITDLAINFDAGFATVYVGETVQKSGITTNDFSNPVTYRIVSWDKETSNTYVVDVDKQAPRSDKQLFSFGFKGINDTTTIDHESMVIKSLVPFGTSLNRLVAEFSVSESAIVKVSGATQVSGVTVNNFLAPVKYRIIAQDGSYVEYQVIIEEDLNDKNNFLYFAFNDPAVVGEIDNQKRTITIKVPEGTDVSAQKPIISTSKNSTALIGGTVQVSGVSVVDFSNSVYYIVKAENGDLALYTVTVLYN